MSTPEIGCMVRMKFYSPILTALNIILIYLESRGQLIQKLWHYFMLTLTTIFIWVYSNWLNYITLELSLKNWKKFAISYNTCDANHTDTLIFFTHPSHFIKCRQNHLPKTAKSQAIYQLHVLYVSVHYHHL